jgi:thiol-disulfide isomerase/thioredoxin
MRFLILFTFLITNVFASDVSEIKNIVIHKNPKILKNIIFLDKKDREINISNFIGNLIILNFWATWCEPCKEEMSSLDRLQVNSKLANLKIFAINIGKENKIKTDNFFEDLNIKNFDSYFDSPVTLAKKFSLRGVPTSILIDKDGQEFARIIGSINFDSNNFIDWLKDYN